jgi:Spy/CpxP family protein refolding chaperone
MNINLKLPAIAISLLLLPSPFVRTMVAQTPEAQSTPATPATPDASAPAAKPVQEPAARMKRLAKELSLTDDQKTALKPILKDQYDQLVAIQADTTLSDKQRKKKNREVNMDANTKMEAILTDDQKAKVQAAMHKGKGGGGEEAPAPAAPAPNAGV